MENLDNWLKSDIYEPKTTDELLTLLDGYSALGLHHYNSCDGYRRIIDGLHGGEPAFKVNSLSELPFLPASIFKKAKLASVEESDLNLTLTSSGTTGQTTSKIYVDVETSGRQQRALAECMASVLGRRRLPMLVADSESVIRNPRLMNARGAGVLGMMRFGSRTTFLLNADMDAQISKVEEFLEKFGGQPFFIFGFTFMVWRCLIQEFRGKALDLSNAVLVHSGGWKQMEHQSVNAAEFKKQLREKFSIKRFHNFYGMVEQLGSLHMEGIDGLLYPPKFSSVIIRDPVTWKPQQIGKPGIIQVLSLIPKSYPGFSILTEDQGVLNIGKSSTGKKSIGLKVLGRLPNSELRGCSDVIASGYSK